MTDYMKIAREVMQGRHLPTDPLHPERVETVLKGRTVELWSDAAEERFWLVADEQDAGVLGEPRGTVYTAAEARLIVQIADSSIVADVHRWKRRFDATVREFRRDDGAASSQGERLR